MGGGGEFGCAVLISEVKNAKYEINELLILIFSLVKNAKYEINELPILIFSSSSSEREREGEREEERKGYREKDRGEGERGRKRGREKGEGVLESGQSVCSGERLVLRKRVFYWEISGGNYSPPVPI